MQQVYFLVTTVETTRTEPSKDGTLVEVTIPAGTVVNTVLWDGETAWEPGESMQAVLESEYLAANAAKKLN